MRGSEREEGRKKERYSHRAIPNVKTYIYDIIHVHSNDTNSHKNTRNNCYFILYLLVCFTHTHMYPPLNGILIACIDLQQLPGCSAVIHVMVLRQQLE